MTQNAMKMRISGTKKPMSRTAVSPPGTPGHELGRELDQDPGGYADDDRSNRQQPRESHEGQAEQLLLDERAGLGDVEDAGDAARHRPEEAERAPRQEDDREDRHFAARLDGRIDDLADHLGVDRRPGRHLVDDELPRLVRAEDERRDDDAEDKQLEDREDAEVRHPAGVLEGVMAQEPLDRPPRDARKPMALGPPVDALDQSFQGVHRLSSEPSRKGCAA